MAKLQPHRDPAKALIGCQRQQHPGRTDDIKRTVGNHVETGRQRIIAALIPGHFRAKPDRAELPALRATALG